MKILHVFRTPVGGLFRHVRDLARGQAELGHEVGIICDSTTGGQVASGLLDGIAPYCSLGIARIGISRLPGLGDLSAVSQPHGSMRKNLALRSFTAMAPRAGFTAGWPRGRWAFLRSTRRMAAACITAGWRFPVLFSWHPNGHLARIGTGMIFVCEFERRSFAKKIGLGGKPNTVVHNGLWPEEFNAVKPDADAADVLYMGDMRHLKGVDVLLKALALVQRKRALTACLVGDGPDSAEFKNLAETLGLGTSVAFPGRLPTAQAFKRGKLLVLPSRAESFPYVVLEAAAGRVPMIASDVGGIPEILPAKNLCPPGQSRCSGAAH